MLNVCRTDPTHQHAAKRLVWIEVSDLTRIDASGLKPKIAYSNHLACNLLHFPQPRPASPRLMGYNVLLLLLIIVRGSRNDKKNVKTDHVTA